MNFESQQSINQKWHSLACPHCRSVFRVDKQDLLPIDYYGFSCLSCERHFWIALEENKGISVWRDKPQETHPLSSNQKDNERHVNNEKICPHCFSTMQKGDYECRQCNRTFYDPKWIEKAPYASFGLRKSYEELLQNFDSSKAHDRFASRCVREKNTAFGAYCYGQLLRSNPNNPYSKKKLKYFEAILLPIGIGKKNETDLNAKSPYFTYVMGWLHASLLFLLVGALAIFYIAYEILSF